MGFEVDILSFPSKEKAIEYYFNYYRKNGYPNYNIDDYNPYKEYQKLLYSDDSEILKDGIARQTMLGCGFLWCFFPHWIEVSTSVDKSLKENWEDDTKLRQFILKCMNWCISYEHGRWSVNRVRQTAKVYLSKQSPSNFRPTVSKALYNKYGNHGKVYDPCGGWGGRLFGFLASDCEEYVCCEPSTKTYQGLLQIKELYSYLDKKVTILNQCQEDADIQYNYYRYFDLVFTSPPYFDNEKYSEEDTQSYIRYPTVDEWVKIFLATLIRNSYIALKPGGVFILNIANTNNAKMLEKASVDIAKIMGFEHIDTLKLTLSSIAGKGTKYEPMFVFKKIIK